MDLDLEGRRAREVLLADEQDVFRVGLHRLNLLLAVVGAAIGHRVQMVA